MEQCTWQGCEDKGTEPQFDREGNQWACLCKEHEAILNESCDLSLSTWTPKRMMWAWINAQGGAEAAAKRM